MPDTPNATPTNYNSAYTGPEIDAAVGAVLTKEADWDVAASGKLPAGGEVGQILEKTGVENYAAGWRTPPFLVRPNLLDNWYFVGGGIFPINQRGQTSYSLLLNDYGVDRWKAAESSLNVVLYADGISITTGSSPAAISQTVDVPFEAIAGKTITYSILYAGGFATGTGVVPSTIPSAEANVFAINDQVPNGYYCRVRITADGKLKAQIGQTAGNTLKITAGKLEFGNIQTLAHLENGVWVLNAIPNSGEELAKCRRYYQRLSVNGSWAGYSLANVMAYTATQANLTLRLGMRVTGNNSVIVDYSSYADIVLAALYIAQGVPIASTGGIANPRVTASGDITMILTINPDENGGNSLTPGAAYNAAIKAGGNGYIAFSTEP